MNINKEITLSANITDSENRIIAVLRGSISTENPEHVSYSPTIIEQTLYRQNRTKVKEEIAMFEDALYAEQDKLLETTEEVE